MLKIVCIALLFLFPIKTFVSKYPEEFKGSFFNILPKGSIEAEIPVFATLIKCFPSSTALNLELMKCWWGPIVFPNQASFVKFTKNIGLFLFFTNFPGNIDS